MTDKTPEELALDSFLASKTPVERLQITLEESEQYFKVFLAGYHSRDAEIAELKKRLAKAEDPYAE